MEFSARIEAYRELYFEGGTQDEFSMDKFFVKGLIFLWKGRRVSRHFF